jgi:hypothetical protein
LKDNIKISLREIVWGDMDWIELSQGREPVRAVTEISGFFIKFWMIFEYERNWWHLEKKYL